MEYTRKSEWMMTKGDKINSNCLVECFKHPPKYNELRAKVFGVFTRNHEKDFNVVCDTLESNIEVIYWQDGQQMRRRRTHRGTVKYNNTVTICLLYEHYFPYKEKTQYYTKFIEKRRWRADVNHPSLHISKITYMDSWNLVLKMLRLKDYYFDEFDSKMFKCVNMENNGEEIIFGDGVFDVANDSRPKGEFKESIKEYSHIIHADIETTTDGRVHKPYLICGMLEDGSGKVYFTGKNCVKNFIDDACRRFDKPLFKFQNLGYDIKFIIPHLTSIISTIEPSAKRCYRLKAYYKIYSKKKVEFTFVDQLAQIPIKLESYAEFFKMEEGKMKNFPYHMFKEDSVELPYLQPPIHLHEELRKCFPKDYWKTIYDKKTKKELHLIDHIQYAIDYCFQDIETQRKGFLEMKKRILDQSGIDFTNYLTISSLSNAHIWKNGGYDGVYEITGKTALFIRKCVVGGRTMASLHNKNIMVFIY